MKKIILKIYNIDIFFIMIFFINLATTVVDRFDYSFYLFIAPMYFLIKGVIPFYIEFNEKEKKRINEKYNS